MRHYIYIALQLLVFPLTYAQQKEGNWWFFGQQAGVNFNTSSAISHIQNLIISNGGAGSISDQNGNLLFYTNGSVVYNRNNQLMSSGSNLFPGIGNPNSRQVIITKIPNKTSEYIVFVTCPPGLSYPLRYFTIDMNLQNGLGQVVNQNVLFNTSSNRMMVLDHNNGLDKWFVCYNQQNFSWRVYKIDSSGINFSFNDCPQKYTSAQIGCTPRV